MLSLLRASSCRSITVAMRASSRTASGPVSESIERKLQEAFSPAHLEVVNESFKHNVPPGSESHFKVWVVSEAFEGKAALARHRLVNAVLSEELAGAVHALSIKAQTPEQWQASPQIQETPQCRGGSKA